MSWTSPQSDESLSQKPSLESSSPQPIPLDDVSAPKSPSNKTPSQPSPLDEGLAKKYDQLQNYLRSLKSVIVAFSGGIDSSLVAYVAHQVLGERMLAVTSASESLKRDDLHLTQHLAEQWKMPYRVIHTQELKNPNYLANPTNRCYYCKTTLYQDLDTVAKQEHYAHVVNGTNLDDFQDHRPGLIAAQEHSVRAPLADCQFRKTDIRKLSDYLGLENSQKPQAACLSSRIPYGTAVSRSTLQQIERAETILLRLGFSQCRVRHHDTVARIEIPPVEFTLALEKHHLIEKRLKACGYLYVTLDLGGFRSGSLNQALTR